MRMCNFFAVGLISLFATACAHTPAKQAGASSATMHHRPSDEEIAKKREDCVKNGGIFQVAGRAGGWICITEFADAGKECSDGSECLGKACYIYDRESTPKIGEPAHGLCRRDSNPFGCHARVINGQFAGYRCVD